MKEKEGTNCLTQGALSQTKLRNSATSLADVLTRRATATHSPIFLALSLRLRNSFNSCSFFSWTELIARGKV